MQASEGQQIVRYESSSSDESVGTVAVQYRIPAERDRKQTEMEAMIATLEKQSSKQQWQEVTQTLSQADLQEVHFHWKYKQLFCLFGGG